MHSFQIAERAWLFLVVVTFNAGKLTEPETEAEEQRIIKLFW